MIGNKSCNVYNRKLVYNQIDDNVGYYRKVSEHKAHLVVYTNFPVRVPMLTPGHPSSYKEYWYAEQGNKVALTNES